MVIWYKADMGISSLPLNVREVRATERVLERIYDAAYLGLKGDRLALAAGMLPTEFNRLKEFDEIASMAELKGRADSEYANSKSLHDAAAGGDTRAALEILKHNHDWVARQAISVEVDQRISILDALAAAEQRVIEAKTVELTEGEYKTDDNTAQMTYQNNNRQIPTYNKQVDPIDEPDPIKPIRRRTRRQPRQADEVQLAKDDL